MNDYETEQLIDQIEKIREGNNRRWMDLVRIAFRYAPDEARITMKAITENDCKVTELMREMAA